MKCTASRTRRLIGPAIAAILAATLVPAVASTDASAQPGDVVGLINAQRTQRGLPALTVNSALNTAAQQHAAAAVQLKWWGPGQDSHTNPQTGSTPQSRIMGAGYCPNPRSWQVAEITYTGWGTSGTPSAAVRWWMNSPGHRANILSGTLREIGSAALAGSADRAGAGASGAATYVVTFGRCQR